MIGMTLKVSMVNGTTLEVPITYGVACRWEDAHPLTSISEFLETMKFKQLAWLAWDAVKTYHQTNKTGEATKVFTAWIDDLETVTFIPKDSPTEPDTPTTS